MEKKLSTRPAVFPEKQPSLEEWMKDMKVSSRYGIKDNVDPFTSTLTIPHYVEVINKLFYGKDVKKKKKSFFHRSTKLRILFGIN